ncbi:MAG: C_GCAxxG_C_C family protein [Spirochaetes bacterium]|nr:MAG: C_GCAxxG_C_C family protein [Spirochaetota bacterium]
MTRTEKALAMFKNGSACSQAILAAFGPGLGLGEALAHRLATGLGAGLGRKQYVCGAISAGVLVLGLKYGNERPEEGVIKEEAYTITREFIDALECELGSSSCRELLGAPILTDEERKAARERGLFDTICPRCVEAVARRLEGLV